MPPPPVADQATALPANASGVWFGIYPAVDFNAGLGSRVDGNTVRQVRWYFDSEFIALPKAGMALASLGHGVSALADLATWLSRPRPAGLESYPALVWVAAPHLIAQARIDPRAMRLLAPDGSWKVILAPQLPLNRSYFDGASAAWFAQRPLRVRGRVGANGVVVRTFWPKDFRLPLDARRMERAEPPVTPEAMRALVQAEPKGGAASPFSASLLWHRGTANYAVPAGRSVVALIVNGAQGDDDEAHGGHFALVTGRTAPDGSIADWLVNNFYSLDSESEKGIIAAPVPLDNYLADLNSGQGYYRPSAMLVAVLANDSAALLLQSALNRIYAQFYRHQIVYDHAAMNCAGISVDVLRALGLPVPVRGAAAPLRAALGLPWLMLKQRSVAKACTIYDYLTEDQTRLLPGAAFEEIGASLVRLACAPASAPTASLASLIAATVEGLFFLRFPQFPSGRPLGDAPVVTPFEYRARLPADPAAAQIIPLPPRPFPAELRDEDLLPAPSRRSERALTAWAAVSVVGLPWLMLRAWRARKT